jgi:multiple sugar transport system substrate-binding protein
MTVQAWSEWMRSLRRLAALIAAASLIVVGCSSGSTSTSSPEPGASTTPPASTAPASTGPSTGTHEEITVLTLGDGIFGSPFVKLTDQFTSETGIPVNLVTMGYDEEIQKSLAAFAAKSNEYDVIQADYIFVKGWAKAGHLEPLDNWLGADVLNDYWSDVPAAVKDMYDWQGHPIGMGTIGNSQKFVYNTAALQAAGVDVPKTWEELLVAAQKIKATGNGTYGFTAGLEKLVKATGVWLPIFISNGGQVFDESMHPQINSQAAKDALTYLIKLVDTMPPGGAAYTEGDEIKSIATGTAGLDPVAWVPDGYTTAAADLQSNLAFGLQPAGSSGSKPVMGGLGLTVSAYSTHKADAAAYVAWFNSKKVQSDLIVQNGGQPVRASAWAANADAQPWFQAQADNLAAAWVRPQIPEWSQVDTAIGTAMSQALSGELTVDQAMDQAQQQVDQIMKDAGYYQ